MKVGTRSLLFGVHQFLWHPITVARAWRKRYGKWPSFYEAAAIVVHDWGYWGSSNMDGEEGKRHPERGARAIYRFVSWCEALRGRDSFRAATVIKATNYFRLVLCHSRSMAQIVNLSPSALCDPDKDSILFDPLWFYYLRGMLSGEIREYRINAIRGGFLNPEATHWQWVMWYHARIKNRSGQYVVTS